MPTPLSTRSVTLTASKRAFFFSTFGFMDVSRIQKLSFPTCPREPLVYEVLGHECRVTLKTRCNNKSSGLFIERDDVPKIKLFSNVTLLPAFRISSAAKPIYIKNELRLDFRTRYRKGPLRH